MFKQKNFLYLTFLMIKWLFFKRKSVVWILKVRFLFIRFWYNSNITEANIYQRWLFRSKASPTSLCATLGWVRFAAAAKQIRPRDRNISGRVHRRNCKPYLTARRDYPHATLTHCLLNWAKDIQQRLMQFTHPRPEFVQLQCQCAFAGGFLKKKIYIDLPQSTVSINRLSMKLLNVLRLGWKYNWLHTTQQII